MRDPQSNYCRCECTGRPAFTLVTAIFLITILFLLSAYMIGFRVYQEAGVTLDTRGTRAYAAARAGVEWGAYQALRTGPCVTGTTSLALAGTLAGLYCTATVRFKRSRTMRLALVSRYAISRRRRATNLSEWPGTCPNPAPGANYAERQITIIVGQP